MKITAVILGRISSQMRDGGSIRFVNIFKKFIVKGVDITFILSKRDLDIFRSYDVKGKYYVVSEHNMTEKHSVWHLFFIYIKRMFKALKIKGLECSDIIYAHSDFIYDVVPAVILKRKMRAKLVVCLFLLLRKPWFRKGAFNMRSLCYYLVQQASLFLINRYADLVLVLNKLDKEYLESIGLKSRIEVVDMGVPIDAIAQIEDNDKRYDGIFLGRFHPQKGIIDLLEIWKNVCDKRTDAKLAIIGSGDKWWTARLNKEIFDRKLYKNIDLLGYKDGDEKFSILKSGRVFLFPSHYESWGMVVAEAMACGIPVVAYNLDIFKDIFSGGIKVINLGDINEFAEEVLKILKDETLYHSMSIQARKGITRYDWNKVAERDLCLLKELL